MKHHIAIKFLALLLCAATLALALGCSLALVVLAENDLFDKDFAQMRQEKLESAGWDMAYYLAGQYALKNLSNCSQETLYAIGAYNSLESYLYSGYALVFEDGEWFYTISDRAGRVLDSSPVIPEGLKPAIVHKVTYPYPILITYDILDEATERTETAAADQPDNATVAPVEIPEYEYTSIYYNEEGNAINGYFSRGESPEYTVSLYLTEDAFPIYAAADWQLLELAQQYRYYLVGGLIVSLLLFAVTLVYLCCAAGKKPGSDEITPQAFNALPLDLYVIGGSFCIAGLFALVRWGISRLDYSHSGSSFLPPVLLIAGAVYVACLIVVGFLCACAAQFKMPGTFWLRRSMIGTLCLWGSKALLWLWHIFVKCCKWIYHAFFPFLKRIAAGFWHRLTKLFRAIKAALQRTFRLLPLTWQWVLVCIFMTCTLLLAVLSHSIWAVLIAVGIALAIILYSSNCFGILHENTKRMSKGDLDTKISDQFLAGCFKDFAADLNALADVAVVAAEKQMRSERMKAELVTNVSHDIKTPLTSIINYVDLLQKATTQEQAEEYLEVLERQSLRLKKLIDDLMEMSKASTGNLSVSITQVNAEETINQSLGEFADKLAAVELTPIFKAPEKPILMRADGRLAWRVLSNLLSNAVKYALPGTRLYVDLVTVEDKVLISLKNISKEQLNVSSEELMERFVRGDASRNTEGSGLGLNIAKSLMELQHGQLQLLVDGDLFKATLIFPADNS